MILSRRDPRRDPRLLPKAAPLPTPPPPLPLPVTVAGTHSVLNIAGAVVRPQAIQVQVTGLDDNWTNYLAAEVEQKAIQTGPIGRGEETTFFSFIFLSRF